MQIQKIRHKIKESQLTQIRGEKEQGPVLFIS